MGSATSDIQGSSFVIKLTYIQNVHDKHFGPIEIYRTKEAPFEYIMDYKKSFIEDSNRLTKYLNVVNKLKNMEHRNLAKLHHSQLVEQNQLCTKNRLVHTFTNYYNFTLEEAIDKKKAKSSCFRQNQLVYIMWCLIDLAMFLQQHNLSVGEYRSQSIFLSPEGYIKMFMLEADEDYQHSCYYKVLLERSLIQNYIFSPQQLQSLNNKEYDITYDVEKADVFAIGILMLQLVTLDKSKFYYNSEKTGLKMDRIVFDLSSMSENYSQDFINLLRSCLNPIPQDRYTYEEAYDDILHIKKRLKGVTNCLRLQDDEGNGRRNQTRENGKTAKGEGMIKGVQKKLTPTPTPVSANQNRSSKNTTSTLTSLNLLTLGVKTQSTINTKS